MRIPFNLGRVRTIGVFGTIGTTLVIGASGLVAQNAPDNNAEASRMFRSLDVNQDGRLTLDEAPPMGRAMMEQIFNRGGKPQNGSLSREEFQRVFDQHRAESRGGSRPPAAPMSRPPSESDDRPVRDTSGGGLPPLLAQLDGNSDGRLQRSELQRLTQLFDRLDANKDGALSAEEIEGVANLPRPSSDSSSNGSARPKSTSTKSATGSGSGTGTSRPANRPAADKSANETTSTKASDRPAAGGPRNRSVPAGVWRGWIVNGRGENPNSGQMEIELTVEANRITGREVGTRRAPEGIGGGTFTMTGDGRSGNLDAEGTSGPQDGRTFLGIYEYDGEVLRWCVSNRGRQRPETFASDRGNYLLVLRQQQWPDLFAYQVAPKNSIVNSGLLQEFILSESGIPRKMERLAESSSWSSVARFE